MFQKRQGYLIATDESTGTLVNFDWGSPGMPSALQLMAYERDGLRYCMYSETVWSQSGLLRDRRIHLIRVSLRSVRQQQLAGPSVPPVSQEMRERIAADLKAAAHALGFVCEILD